MNPTIKSTGGYDKKIHKKHPVGCFLIDNNFLILVCSEIENEGYAKNRTGIAETYYYAGGADKPLAANILNNMASNTGLQSNGICFGNFYVLRENPIIAVLGELGYISNPN
ncbi:N-acetylmuramoyl-L-alanine amidase family protein [Bacillus haynesii]|uniref:N-acetylmuramoyl-L-alanine amidase family protein n=1 Tax=Bacillus haynesii TaxID=1925021 RepID=UPI001300FA30|nr:N-acetylmuramoyl-L-alanine amidase [Bacillus haynesii]